MREVARAMEGERWGEENFTHEDVQPCSFFKNTYTGGCEHHILDRSEKFTIYI